MYCPYCGRTLRKNESCCCCKSVAIRNGEPGFGIQRSFIKMGHPEEFEHGHGGTSYKTDVYGKYDANAYDISKYYNSSKFASKPGAYGTASKSTANANTYSASAKYTSRSGAYNTASKSTANANTYSASAKYTSRSGAYNTASKTNARSDAPYMNTAASSKDMNTSKFIDVNKTEENQAPKPGNTIIMALILLIWLIIMFLS